VNDAKRGDGKPDSVLGSSTRFRVDGAIYQVWATKRSRVVNGASIRGVTTRKVGSAVFLGEEIR
jgi:hypothetical protein